MVPAPWESACSSSKAEPCVVYELGIGIGKHQSPAIRAERLSQSFS
jgi:hypothetical protein